MASKFTRAKSGSVLATNPQPLSRGTSFRAPAVAAAGTPLVSYLIKENIWVYGFIILICLAIGVTVVAINYDQATTDSQKSRIAASTFFLTIALILIILYFIS